MAGDGDASEAALQDQLLSLGIETRLTIVGHTATEETVRILPLYLLQIIVLQTVDKLLHHNGSAHLGIVHVREVHLGRVLTVDHKRRHHLHLLAKEDTTTVLQRTDGFPVPTRVLSEPQMAMRVDDDHEFFQRTNIWSPMISCTFATRSKSIGSLTYSMFFSTFSGLALLKSVVAMRGFRLVENCTASFSIG